MKLHQWSMTDDEIKAAKAAGKLATAHMQGAKLIEAIRIGESLLVGRRASMKAVGLDPAGNASPNGKQYAEAFRQWKEAFRFPTGKEAGNFYDVCIVIAEHRSIADGIIASLDVKQRSEMGAFGLAKRVRAKLREFDGDLAPAKKKPAAKAKPADVVGRIEKLADEVRRKIPNQPSDLYFDLSMPEESAENFVQLYQGAGFEAILAFADCLKALVGKKQKAAA